MILRKVKLCLICAGLLTVLCGCGDKSELKDHLAGILLENELPEVEITDCTRLYEADDAVYEQQLAACEMYYEAYTQTKTSDYVKIYKDDLKDEKIAYYCNLRRKELQKEIAEGLKDNVLSMIGTVEDCDNISAYTSRVNDDVVNFYDYYAAYEYAQRGEKEEAICDILAVFYERSNIFAFRFMEENREDFIEAVTDRIIENSYATESLNMYISMNNALTKALNTVYGGVPEEYSRRITEANIRLARRLLEEDNDLSELEINSLMYQLGEPTPEPTEKPTEKPTPEPTEKPTVRPTARPVATAAPTPRPTQTPRPTAAPIVTEPPEPESTPIIITIGD